MAIDMSETKELLKKISNKVRPKTTLEVNGNNGAGISFEQILVNELQDRNDEMYGDQLLGHPVLEEFKNKGKY